MSITIRSDFGDMQVVVLLPGYESQQAYSFRPTAHVDGLKDVPRRDLSVIRAMLQDALDDVDDERKRRIRTEQEQAFAQWPPAPAPAPYPTPGVLK